MTKEQRLSRLVEATQAVRELRSLPSADWVKKFPNFAKAIDEATLVPNETAWNARCFAMQTEIILLTAEYVSTL